MPSEKNSVYKEIFRIKYICSPLLLCINKILTVCLPAQVQKITLHMCTEVQT